VTTDVDETETSPDGWLRVDYRVEPGRMSHWIRNPAVVDTRTGKTLFSLFSGWDADRVWGGPGVVTLNLRYYPEGGWTWIGVTIDAGRREGRIDDGDWRSLDGLARDMEAAFERKAAKARGRDSLAATGPVRHPVTAFHVLRFLAILVAAIGVLAGGAYLYETNKPAKPERPLATIPIPKK
jgi:hypothetical protein